MSFLNNFTTPIKTEPQWSMDIHDKQQNEKQSMFFINDEENSIEDEDLIKKDQSKKNNKKKKIFEDNTTTNRVLSPKKNKMKRKKNNKNQISKKEQKTIENLLGRKSSVNNTIKNYITKKERKCINCGKISSDFVNYDSTFKFYNCKKCGSILSYNVKTFQLDLESIPDFFKTVNFNDEKKKKKGTYKRAPINAVKKAVSRLWRGYEKSNKITFEDIPESKKNFLVSIIQRKSSFLKPKSDKKIKFLNVSDYYPINAENLKKQIINRKKFTYNAIIKKKELSDDNPMKKKMGKDYILDIKIYSTRPRNKRIFNSQNEQQKNDEQKNNEQEKDN